LPRRLGAAPRAALSIGTRLPSGELPRRSSRSDPSPRSLRRHPRSGAGAGEMA
jgi:hypothetical protein